MGEATAQPAGISDFHTLLKRYRLTSFADGVTTSEPAKLETKTEANKITKPAAKTGDQKKGTASNLLNELMFWKKDKKAQA